MLYQLQYLDAKTLAPVLTDIVKGGGSNGPSQASAGEQKSGGIERFFDNVIIYTDSPNNEGGDNANSSDNQTCVNEQIKYKYVWNRDKLPHFCSELKGRG